MAARGESGYSWLASVNSEFRALVLVGSIPPAALGESKVITRDDLVVHIDKSPPCTPENTMVEVRLSICLRSEISYSDVLVASLNVIDRVEQQMKDRIMHTIYGDIRKAVEDCRMNAVRAAMLMTGIGCPAQSVVEAFDPLLKLLE